MKVLKEFRSVVSVQYPTDKYPQDLIDAHIMPALRRSYDRARRENWRMAKETTSKFTMKVGPVTKTDDGYVHQFGWYVACELEEDEDAVHN